MCLCMFMYIYIYMYYSEVTSLTQVPDKHAMPLATYSMT